MLGMLVATATMAGPSSIVTIFTLHFWGRFKTRPWRRAVEAGIVPVTTGLVAASAVLITEASATDWMLWIITSACAVLATTTRIHPLWLLLGGSLAALAGFAPS